MRETNEWAVRAVELLATGEWVSGSTFLTEVSKKIPPGIGWREAARNRVSIGEDDDSHREAIRAGKRRICTQMITSRILQGVWEVDPWPMPTDGWRQGAWKVRSRVADRHGYKDLARRFQCSWKTAKNIVLADPPFPTRYTSGVYTYIRTSDLPEFEQRLKEYREKANSGRGGNFRKNREQTTA